MKTTYFPQDDILEIRFSDKPITREASQDWNVNISFAADGSIVGIVILDAVKAGFMPFESGEPHRQRGLRGHVSGRRKPQIQVQSTKDGPTDGLPQSR